MSIEIDTCQRVSIIADNDSIRIHARYEYESIESSEILGLSTVARYEVIDALKYLTAGALSRMDSGGYQHDLILSGASLISRYDDLI